MQGRITLSQQRVLAYSVTSLKTRKPVSAEQFAAALNMDEVRFRGITLEHYHRGRWRRFGDRNLLFPDSQLPTDQVPGSGNLEPEFRVEITQDAPVGAYAFAPYPVLSMSAADKPQSDWHSADPDNDLGRKFQCSINLVHLPWNVRELIRTSSLNVQNGP